jgi:hypothetical protein
MYRKYMLEELKLLIKCVFKTKKSHSIEWLF